MTKALRTGKIVLFSFYFHLLLLVNAILPAYGQGTDTIKEVSLETVVVRAYEANQRLKDIPAAINYVGKTTLARFNPAAIVQAINTTPGVRMEERSPGSYRFSIRGSSLRSPFGVRNVKVYLNDLPYTEPGGHTYLNQLGYYNFKSLEIIKGPGSSLYGAGTGGVLLIESLSEQEQSGAQAEYAPGSYGLHNLYSGITTGTDKIVSSSGYQHQESKGYRNHSELKRDVLSWTGLFRFNEKRTLKTSFLYSHLFYETPGALTLQEYESDPRAARPGNAFFPGAEAANASITQKSFLAGASYLQQILPWLQNKSTLYVKFTELRNPTIQNYGRSSEPQAGGRTLFKLAFPQKTGKLTLDVGAEWQEGFTSVGIHLNRQGNADSLRTLDEITNRQSFLFTQAKYDYGSWSVTAGGSLNFLRVKFERLMPATQGQQLRQFSNQLAPRLALIKKFNQLNIYTSVSKGFSPPTTAELLPTGGAINLGLEAEEGINYDLGLKGNLLKNLYIDINAFYFRLVNTIVQRRTAGGGDFFINAGKTRQNGIETYMGYPLGQSGVLMDQSLLWLSHTWHHFRYSDFKQQDNDFSGNELPGVAPHTISTGYDFFLANGVLGTLSYFYSDRLPLNDANSVYADVYHLLSLKLGYQKQIGERFRMKLLGGVDNLLDKQYSLGNDINGFGGRYYNSAAGRNYYIALAVQLITRKSQ